MRRASAVAVALLCLFLTRADVAVANGRPAAAAKPAAERHCYSGCPKVKANWRRGGPLIPIDRAAYSLEVSTATKVPFWVAEYVTAAEVDGEADRAGYRNDPLLADEPHSTVKDYREASVAYDIGHQAPAANHKRSQNRMDETFYLSNMAPQIPAFNRGIWRTLETRSRKWILQRGRAWCITGPIFAKDEVPNPDFQPKTIGKNRVAVPTHFYKILVAPRGRRSNEVESIAFIFPNKKITRYEFEDYIRPVSDVEKLTGIDFMPQLTAAERKTLETAKAPTLW